MLLFVAFLCCAWNIFRPTCSTCSNFDLDIYGDAIDGYYVETYFGTPSQKLNLLLDTGSSNLAVACASINGKAKYFRFNDSRTCSISTMELRLQYVVGDWKGFMANDFMSISASEDSKFQLQFACMTSITQIFDNQSQFQGLLGLAYPAIAKPDPSIIPFFDSLTKKKNVCDIFSLLLCGPFVTSLQQRTFCGKLHLGYIEKASYKDKIIFTPIKHEWYYEIMLTSLKVGEKSIPISCFELNKPKSIIDSGTTELKFPEKVYNWVIKELRNSTNLELKDSFWYNNSVECLKNSNNISVFPSIIMSLYHTGNSTFSLFITSELYLLRTKGSDFCFKLGITKSEESYGTVIGATVLKGFYVVFDRNNKQIGFSNSTYSKNAAAPISFVFDPIETLTNILECEGNQQSKSSASVGIIVLGCIAILCAAIFLFVMMLWIWKNIIRWEKKDEDSESMSILTEE